jgi:WD40 repeat protein
MLDQAFSHKPTKDSNMKGKATAPLVISQLVLMVIGAHAQEKPEVFVQTGRSSQVMSVVFSPDGQYLALGKWKKTIMWEVKTGKEIRTLKGHSNAVNSVAFSPDGTVLASGSTDKTIKLWDVATGKEIRTLEGHRSDVTSVAFSPDGKTLASGSYDRTIKLWDVSTGRLVRTLERRKGLFKSFIESISGISAHDVYCVAFSPDGKVLASGGQDETIMLWDAATGKEIRTLTGHSSHVKSVVFSPNGKLLASLTEWGKAITLWDVSTGEETRTLEGHQDKVISVAFSPDGNSLASGSLDSTIKFWDVATGKEIRTLRHQDQVFSVAFSADGKMLASGSEDGSTRLWNIQTGKELAMFANFTDGEWVVLTPEGYYSASAKGDQYLNVRIGNSVYGIENYRATFMRPDLVQAALSGK